MEQISYLAHIPKIQGAFMLGDDGARVVFDSKEGVLDRAEALKLAALPGKVLHLRVYLGTDQDPYCEFKASIPLAMSSISVGSIVRVKFDIPGSDKLQAMHLAGVNDRMLRIVIDSDGKSVVKGSKEKKEASPYGKFWEYLDRANFVCAPDLAEMFATLEQSHGYAERSADADVVAIRKAILRTCFGNASRAQAVSPDRLRSWLKQMLIQEGSSVYGMIRNAEAYAVREADRD
jgi:hypothetical protein